MQQSHIKCLNIVIILVSVLSGLLISFTTPSPIAAAELTETTVGPDIFVDPAEYSYTAELPVTSSEIPYMETGMANPAAVYCNQLGYEYISYKTPFGKQEGVCALPEQQTCPAWDFLTGSCGAEYNACAREDMLSIVRNDGRNGFTETYVECADPHTGFTAAATKLVDMTSTTIWEPAVEFEAQTSEETNTIMSTTSLPTTYDWRDVNGQNWMTPVRDQGSCGSCWAFASVGIVEANANITNDNPNIDLDLSEQTLVSDCCVVCGDCGGGNHAQALYKMKNDGIPDEGCFPYTAGDGGDSCSDASPDMADRLYQIDTVANLGSNPGLDVIKTSIMDKGPLLGALYHTSDGTWNGDVFSCSSTTAINHSVVIVGWDDASNAWIVRNSWGEDWNGDGYYKVAYNSCFLENYLYYVDATPQFNDVTITNEGSDTLTVTDIAVENQSCWLSTSLTSADLPVDLQPGENLGFNLIFDDSCVAPGIYTDAVLVSSNDPDENPTRVPVEYTKPAEVVNDPDLSLSNVDIDDNPVVAGQSFTWSGLVTNLGTSDAGASTLKLYTAATCDGATTLVDSISTAALAAGASTPFSLNMQLGNDDAGTLAFIAKADDTNVVVESNESNNSVCVERTVQGCYTLDTNVTGQGSISVNTQPNCGTGYVEGTVVTLTATAASGWQFDGWNGAITGTTNPQAVTMNGNKSVSASFSEIPPTCYSLDVTTSGSGSVSASPAPNCGSDYLEGTVVTLTASPASGWQFDGWSGALTGTTNPKAATMSGNKSVTATFSEIPPTCYTLDVITSGSGSVSASPAPNCGSDYLEGTVVTLTATPTTGWSFDGWSGALTGTTNPKAVTMSGNKSVTATFSEIPPACFSLSLNANGQGDITADPAPNCGGSYTEGTVVTLTAVPASGWQFDGWSDALSGTSNPQAVTVNSNTSVTASFSEIPPTCYALDITITGQGTVSPNVAPNCGNDYLEGTVVTLTANPASGWQFDGWSNALSGSTNPQAVTMNSNTSVSASFSEIPPTCYALDITVNGQGDVTASMEPNCGTGYTEGTIVTLTANPASGWSFDSWSGDANSYANPLSVTMDGDTSVIANFVEDEADLPEICYDLDTSVSGQGNVQVLTASNCSSGHGYRPGTEVILVAEADNGSDFTGWTGDADGTVNPLQVTLNQDVTVTAEFEPTSVTFFYSILIPMVVNR